MKRRDFVVGASAVAALGSQADLAQAQAGGTLGVLLMHGKQGRRREPGQQACA